MDAIENTEAIQVQEGAKTTGLGEQDDLYDDNEDEEELGEEDDEAVLVDCEWLSDNDDDELQAARRALKQFSKNRKRGENVQEDRQSNDGNRSGVGVEEACQAAEGREVPNRFTQLDIEEQEAEDFDSEEE